MRKNQKMTEAARKKMSLARQGSGNPMYGRPAWNKGLKGIHLSPKSEFKKGVIPWNKGKHPNYVQGQNHPMWRGDSIGYENLHRWVGKILGKPKKCDRCGTINYKRFHWANKTGKYLRDIKDWIRLCPQCHADYDKKNGWGKIRNKYGDKNKKTIKDNFKVVFCLKCGKQFKKPLCRLRIGKGKYCSRKCFLERNKT